MKRPNMVRGIALLAVANTMILTTTQSCDTNSPSDSGSCTIQQRGTNSAGQEYLSYTCQDPNNNGAAVLGAPTDYPSCVVGAYWPNCRKA